MNGHCTIKKTSQLAETAGASGGPARDAGPMLPSLRPRLPLPPTAGRLLGPAACSPLLPTHGACRGVSGAPGLGLLRPLLVSLVGGWAQERLVQWTWTPFPVWGQPCWEHPGPTLGVQDLK